MRTHQTAIRDSLNAHAAELMRRHPGMDAGQAKGLALAGTLHALATLLVAAGGLTIATRAGKIENPAIAAQTAAAAAMLIFRTKPRRRARR
jgi:hypothetical protein